MWAIYALLSAFFVATTDPIAKKIMGRASDEYIIGWLILFFSVPFLGIVYFSHSFLPFKSSLTLNFNLSTCAAGFFERISLFLHRNSALAWQQWTDLDRLLLVCEMHTPFKCQTRPVGAAVQHISLSRRRPRVRIPHGSPAIFATYFYAG